MDFWTSDTHLGHVNIRTYCNRPWDSTEAMNAGLIERWNARVSPQDTVYHLGDFAMGLKHLWPQFRQQLNGRIVLITGNHDDPPEMIRRAMDEHDDLIVPEMLYYGAHGIKIHLAHVPPAYNDSRGLIRLNQTDINATHHFCGHVHDKWAVQPSTGCINVGVDVRDWEPKTLEELGVR